MDLQPGDLLFTRSRTVLGRAIRFFTRSEVNHVAVVAFGGNIVEAAMGGVRIVPQDKMYGEIVHARRIMCTQTQRVLFTCRALSKTCSPYDFGQILAILLKKVLGRHFKASLSSKKRYICSELVFESAEEVGIPTPAAPKRYITPQQVLEWNRLVEVK